jgi:hypothetical protein
MAPTAWNAPHGTTRRELLGTAGLFALGAGLRPGPFARRPSLAASARELLLMGLDGLSRVADDGRDPFTEGHGAAAVLAADFFPRENRLDATTRAAILSLVQARLLRGGLFAPRPVEAADPELVAGLVEDLDAGIHALRRGGHDIIFASIALKALRELPEAATPARIAGLRRMVRSFGTRRAPARSEVDASQVPGLDDGQAFVRFVFQEYLEALELYLGGQGHHGFAGHILTVGHALVELHRMGHAKTAEKGLAAYRQLVEQARAGADLGGQRVADAPARFPSPLERDYWIAQAQRPADGIVSSHLIKYPYSFYALGKELPEDELKRRALRELYHLTAIS